MSAIPNGGPSVRCPNCTATELAKLLEDWLECQKCQMVFRPALRPLQAGARKFRLKTRRVLAQRVERGGPWEIPRAQPGDWIIFDDVGRVKLLPAEDFAAQYEPDANATELEILQRQVGALRIDQESYTRLNQEFARLGVFFREHYKAEIEAGEHQGLSCADVVIRYLTREREQRAREKKLRELAPAPDELGCRTPEDWEELRRRRDNQRTVTPLYEGRKDG